MARRRKRPGPGGARALEAPPSPPRTSVPPLPPRALPPHPGRWLWTCRAGFETHLFEELASQRANPRLLGVALVEASRKVPQAPVFGRMGFEVAQVFLEAAPSPEAIAASLVRAAKGQPMELQAWALDTDEGNRLASRADTLAAWVRALLPASVGSAPVLGQLCVLADSLLAVGAVAAADAVSRAPGGRNRMRREADAPSRAALKLEEALDGHGLAPSRGEVCVDLGAAPGGWTARLVARGARVIAVDPANLSPDLAKNPRVRHLKESAFAFLPDEPVDWLFCDMAWRPLEVAQLLAKWGRNGWALHLCANIKLPMKDKNPILERVRATLATGWQSVRVRQLYHDRDEVTVTAHCLDRQPSRGRGGGCDFRRR